MQYNFDIQIDRSQNYAAKLEESLLNFGTKEVIPLWIADMDFRTAQPIIDVIKARADQGIFGYTFRPDDYFEAVRDWQRRRHGYNPDVERMAFAPGVVPSLRIFLNLFTQPGDKILIQQPVYHPFADIVENTNRTLVVSPLHRDDSGFYTMDAADFEDKVKKGVKYFILCNPHNPVGRVWSKEELKEIGDICVRYGAGILSDEIHSDLILGGNKHTVMATVSPEIAAITSTFISPSKSFNLAGLQASTIIFDTVEHREHYLKTLKEMDIARNNCFSLVATMAAYNEGEEWLEQLLTYVEGNMQFIGDYCRQYLPLIKPNKPEATYMCWLDMRELKMGDDALQEFLVKKAGIALSQGGSFGQGGQGFMRLNAACPRSTLEKALEQLRAALS